MVASPLILKQILGYQAIKEVAAFLEEVLQVATPLFKQRMETEQQRLPMLDQHGELVYKKQGFIQQRQTVNSPDQITPCDL